MAPDVLLGLCAAARPDAGRGDERDRDGVLGHRRQGRRQADLRPARRAGPRTDQDLHLSVSRRRSARRLHRSDPGGRAGGVRGGARIHGGEVRPGGAVHRIRRAPAEPGRHRAVGGDHGCDPRGGRVTGRPAVRNARAVHRCRRDQVGAPVGAVRSAVVRGADAARPARGDGPGRSPDVDPGGDRRATDDDHRVRGAGPPSGGGDLAAEPGPLRRAAGRQEDRCDRRGIGVPDRTRICTRARSSGRRTSSWRRRCRTC